MRKIKKGATLLEVVIALAIISIMMIPLANGLLASVRFNKSAESIQTAKLLSQQLVEKLKIQNKIEQNSTIKFHDTNIELLNKINTGKNIIPMKSSDDINGFNLSGEIIEESNIVSINKVYNDKISNNEINDEIEIFIYLDIDENEKVKGYINRTSGTNNKIEHCFLKENEINGKAIKANDSNEMLIDLRISNKNEVAIKINGNNFLGIDTATALKDGAIAIYVNDARDNSKININVNNELANKKEIQVFRNYKLDKETFDKALTMKKENLKGPINLIKNIIHDRDNGSEGLYTTKIDVLKDGEVIEKTESQFYLGK